jgi:hypothetical protein
LVGFLAGLSLAAGFSLAALAVEALGLAGDFAGALVGFFALAAGFASGAAISATAGGAISKVASAISGSGGVAAGDFGAAGFLVAGVLGAAAALAAVVLEALAGFSKGAVGVTNEADEPVIRPAATCVRTRDSSGTGTTGVSTAGFSVRAPLMTRALARRGEGFLGVRLALNIASSAGAVGSDSPVKAATLISVSGVAFSVPESCSAVPIT